MKGIVIGLGFLATLFGSNNVMAQYAKEAAVKFNKATVNGVVNDYNYSSSVVKIALENRLAQSGLTKSKTTKGFNYFKGISWPELSQEKLDIYYKVSGKKNTSVIEFVVSKGYDNYISSANDAAIIDNLKLVLGTLDHNINNYLHLENIKLQEENIKRMEKEYTSLINANKSLVKDKEHVDKKIEENNNAQNNKIKEIEQAKAALEEMSRG